MGRLGLSETSYNHGEVVVYVTVARLGLWTVSW